MQFFEKAKSSAKWLTASTAIKGILQVLQISILSRILLPEDFGLIAIATSIIAFASIFSELGIGSALIHKQNVTQSQLSSLYWLNLAASTVLVIILVSLSPFVSAFYHDERVGAILRFAAAIFLINATYQQLRFRSEKDLKFKQLSLIEICSAIVGFICAISAAGLGMHAYSIVIGTISTALIASLLSWIFLSAGWRPKLNFYFSDIKDFVGFSFYMVGNGVVSTLNQTADLFVGGKLLPVTQMGIYSVPRNFSLQIALLVNPIVTRIAFPVMAKLQNDKNSLGDAYLKTMQISSLFNFPIYAMLFWFSKEVTSVIFGDNFIMSSNVLQILAIWGAIRSTGNCVGALLLAVGKASTQFYWNLSTLILVFLSLFLGGQFGMLGISYAMLACQVILFIPCWYWLVRPYSNICLKQYCFNLVWPALYAFGAAGIAWIITIQIEASFFRLLGSSIIMAVVYSLLSKPWSLMRSTS